MRLSLVFMLDIIDIASGKGEPLDPLILGVISSASVAPVRHDDRLEQAYATVDAPPPDEVRRPVSISAVARSARLPFETVRRRIAHLAEAGHCEITPRGVVQSAAAVTHPGYLAQAMARYERLKQLYFDMRRAGTLPVERRLAPLSLDGPPVRIANRIIGEYTLRVADVLIRRVGDPVRGVLLLEIARTNGEHLDAVAFEPGRPLPDDERRPVTIAALAARTCTPYETVRRNVQALINRGLVRRVKGGVIVDPSKIDETGGHETARESARNLTRLFARLEQLGVLDWWDAEAAEAETPARAKRA